MDRWVLSDGILLNENCKSQNLQKYDPVAVSQDSETFPASGYWGLQSEFCFPFCTLHFVLEQRSGKGLLMIEDKEIWRACMKTIARGSLPAIHKKGGTKWQISDWSWKDWS